MQDRLVAPNFRQPPKTQTFVRSTPLVIHSLSHRSMCRSYIGWTTFILLVVHSYLNVAKQNHKFLFQVSSPPSGRKEVPLPKNLVKHDQGLKNKLPIHMSAHKTPMLLFLCFILFHSYILALVETETYQITHLREKCQGSYIICPTSRLCKLKPPICKGLEILGYNSNPVNIIQGLELASMSFYM